MEDFIKEFNSSRELSHKVFKNALQPTPAWETFMDYIEKSKIIGNYRSDYEGFYILHTGGDDEELGDFGKLNDFNAAMKKAYAGEIKSSGITFVISKIYRSITDRSGIMKHTDPTDTIHWHCVGATIWRFFEGDSVIEHIVEPGDIIYIKQGTEHEVESLTPRSGIVFSPMTEDAEKNLQDNRY